MPPSVTWIASKNKGRLCSYVLLLLARPVPWYVHMLQTATLPNSFKYRSWKYFFHCRFPCKCPFYVCETVMILRGFLYLHVSFERFYIFSHCLIKLNAMLLLWKPLSLLPKPTSRFLQLPKIATPTTTNTVLFYPLAIKMNFLLNLEYKKAKYIF